MGPFAMPRHPKYTFPSSSYGGSIVAEPRILSGVSSISLFNDFGEPPEANGCLGAICDTSIPEVRLPLLQLRQ